MMGINVRMNSGTDYASLIVTGRKVLETRASDSLAPYVGRRVAIVRTGNGPARAIGSVRIVERFRVSPERFRELESLHCVPVGDAYDTLAGGKWCYRLADPVAYRRTRPVAHGIVARRVL